MLRLLRILPRVPALALVMGSLLETLKNLKHCAGILFAAFYLYASFGMILFQGMITVKTVLHIFTDLILLIVSKAN